MASYHSRFLYIAVKAGIARKVGHVGPLAGTTISLFFDETCPAWPSPPSD